MKKSTIALSIIGLLGVATIGGSYFTGKIAEEKFNDYITQTNQYFQKHSSDAFGAEIKEVKFERHWFSSDVSYMLDLKIGESKIPLQYNDKLYHGPFPMNRVMLGKLAPVAASLESNINTPTELKEWVATPLLGTARTDIGYDESYSGVATLNPIKGQYPEGSFKLELDKTVIKFDTDKNFNGSMSYQTPVIKYTVNETNGIIDGTDFQAEFKRDEAYRFLSNGKFDAKIKSIKISEPENNDVILENFQSKGTQNIKDGRYISQSITNTDIKFAHLEKSASLGKFTFDSDMDIDAKSYDEVMNAAIYKPEASAQLEQVVEQLLAKQPKLNIKALNLENNKGKNHLSLAVNLTKLPSEDENKSLKDMLSVFKQSALNLVINIPAAEEMMKQFATLEPATNEQDSSSAIKAAMEEIKGQAVQSGLFSVSDQEIKSNITIDNGEVKLNGRPVSEEELQMAFFVIAMGLGGLLGN